MSTRCALANEPAFEPVDMVSGSRSASDPRMATAATDQACVGFPGRRRSVRDMRSSLTSVGAGHGHGHAAGRAADRRRLRLVLAITAVVLVVELVGAYLASSLALLADAGHLATDAAAVVLALGASY